MSRAYLIFFLLFAAAHSVFAEDLNLEGVAHDPFDSRQSVAVINGNLVQEGQKVENYKVVQIAPDSVRLSNLTTGQEHILGITGGKPSQKASVANQNEEVPNTSPQEARPPQKDLDNPLAQMLKAPFSMLERAREVSVIADLKKIHMAALAFFNEVESMEEITLAKLVERGMISTAFQSGVKGPYKFSIKSDHGGVTAAADPVNDQSNARHFFIDEHGVLFYDVGKRATAKSSTYEV